MSDRQGPLDPGGGSGVWSSPLLDGPYLDACLQNGVSAGRLLQLAGLFERRFAEDQLGLREALDAGDLARARAAAHRLKGSAGSLGLVKLRSCAADLEAAAKGGDRPACRSALDRLPELGAASLQAFRNHLGDPTPL